MDTIRKPQLLIMLRLQDELNAVINPAWLKADYPFLRAAFVEAGEALDHHGWKWWKNQVPDIGQLQIELIDILHFYLSDALLSNGGDFELTLAKVMSELDEFELKFDGASFEFKSLDVLRLLELLAGLAVVRRRSFGVLSELMDRCGLTWESAYIQYISKNILNIFRQKNGYKEGVYIKIWDGLEDNIWLERSISSLDSTSATFSEDLMSELSAKYQSVTGSVT